MSSEVAIGEAEAALSSRAEAAGVTDPEAFAHEYVTAMLRAGWRHRALPVVASDPKTGEKAKAPIREQAYAEAKAAIAEAKKKNSAATKTPEHEETPDA